VGRRALAPLPLALFDLLLLHLLNVLRLRELPALAGAALKSLQLFRKGFGELRASRGGAGAG
jgi:hypothetical protein